MDESQDPIETVIDDIEGATGDGEARLGDLLDSFEDRSLGAILLIFGVLTATPIIGAVPGLPDLAALVVVIAIGHSFVGGSQHFWAPETLRERTFDAARVDRALARIRPIGRYVDGWVVNDRLAFLAASWPARMTIALVSAGLALLVGLLSFVPFAVVPPALAWALLGVALMGRDGVFALAGYLVTAGSVGLLAYLWGSIF